MTVFYFEKDTDFEPSSVIRLKTNMINWTRNSMVPVYLRIHHCTVKQSDKQTKGWF